MNPSPDSTGSLVTSSVFQGVCAQDLRLAVQVRTRSEVNAFAQSTDGNSCSTLIKEVHAQVIELQTA
jgi:hypothetical protein